MKLHLEDDHWCYVCGSENAKGLKAQFQHPEKGRLTSNMVFSREHQGFKGIVHGGLLSTCLDEIMLNIVLVEIGPAVTGELIVRLKKPARVGERLHFEGKIDQDKGRLVLTSGSVKNDGGELLATAEARCFRIKA